MPRDAKVKRATAPVERRRVVVVAPARNPPARSRGMGREQRREQLLHLAEKVLARGGISALTMESLAVEAGISKPIVYAHFRNRSELLVALFESYWSFVDQLITARRSGAKSAEDYLALTVEAYLDAMEKRGNALRQLLFKVLEDPIVEAARRSRDKFVVDRWATAFFERNGVAKSKSTCLAVMTRELLEATAIFQHTYDGKRRIAEELFVQAVLNMLRANG